MRRAVFLDRDGTLCREVGYVNHPSRLELMPDGAAAIRELNRRGWLSVVVTNQAGVARGYFPYHVVEETHRRLVRLLEAEGARLDAIYVCPHHPEVGGPGFRAACDCRKPRPGMLLRAAREMKIDLARSYIAGDSFRDVGAGRAARLAATVMLRTGYGRGELSWKGAVAPVWPDHVADDLASALAWIVDHAERSDT